MEDHRIVRRSPLGGIDPFHRPAVQASTEQAPTEPTPAGRALASSRPETITADSELLDVLRASVRIRTEMARRKAYQDFLALRDELEIPA